VTYKVFSIAEGPEKRLTRMSEETNPPEETVEFQFKEQAKQSKASQVSLQEILDSLKSAQDDIGQISELASEEERLVVEFFSSLTKVMQPLVVTIPVSPTAIQEYVDDVARATMDQTGSLLVLHRDGEVELKNLSEEKNRNLMIAVLGDVMPKFKHIFGAYRRRIEDRTKFLAAVTKETQKMSKALTKTM
jgi:hypothetical protein